VNLGQTIDIHTGHCRANAAAAPIKLKVWPQQPHGIAALNAARRKPMEQDTLKVRDYIAAHNGVAYPELVKSCGIHRDRLNSIMHALRRRGDVMVKGSPGRKRYWVT